MKNKLPVLVILLSATITGNLFAQGVGINNPTPAPSAMLDVTSTSKGMLIPRMTSAQRLAIVAPANGLMVYETITNQFFYFDSTIWKSFSSATSGWNVTGNAGTVDGTNFIGTTDNVPFNIRVNNQKAGRIDGGGANAVFGFQAGNSVTGVSNSFFGHQAGFNATNAIDNSFFGRNSGFANTSGSGNSFLGNGTGFSNTTGSNNSFVGKEAGRNNISGFSNIAIGIDAMNTSTAASNIVAIGDSALRASTGSRNVAVGSKAGLSNTTGSDNSFFGFEAGRSNTTGGANSFFGKDAGRTNIGGNRNCFFGFQSGLNNTGTCNSFFGMVSGQMNTNGSLNSFFGDAAGAKNTTGNENSFFGVSSGFFTTSGDSNSFFGRDAGSNNTTGSGNSFFGHEAGNNNLTGGSNTIIGYKSDVSTGALTNATAIGANARVNASNSMVLGSISGINGATSSVNVGIGTFSPQTRLQVAGGTDAGSGATSGYLCIGSTSSTNVLYDDNEILARDNGVVSDLWLQADGGNLAIGMVPSPAFNLHLLNNSAAKPSSSVWTVPSDKRLKTNVHDYEDGLSRLMQLHPVWFTYTGEAGMPKETAVGVLAQELQTVAPYMVGSWKFKDKSGASTDYLSVDNGAMTYMLINSVKELKQQNDSQQHQIDELMKIIEQLKK